MKNDVTTVEIGRFGEDAATEFLKKKHYKILDRNVHLSHNEIDIIAEKGKYFVFVEVKTRSYADLEHENFLFGKPADAVDKGKRKRTLEAAAAYLGESRSRKEIRFDIIEVYLGKAPAFSSTFPILKIEHIENAF